MGPPKVKTKRVTTSELVAPTPDLDEDGLRVRRSKRTTAGQGGRVNQLEKAGIAMEKSMLPPKPAAIFAEDEPVNLFAPTPNRAARKKSRKVNLLICMAYCLHLTFD